MSEEVEWQFARNYLKATDLVAPKEIVEITGLSSWYVRALACGVEKSRPPFPDSHTRIGRKRLWLRSDIDHWLISRDKLRAARRSLSSASDHTASVDP